MEQRMEKANRNYLRLLACTDIVEEGTQ